MALCIPALARVAEEMVLDGLQEMLPVGARQGGVTKPCYSLPDGAHWRLKILLAASALARGHSLL